MPKLRIKSKRVSGVLLFRLQTRCFWLFWCDLRAFYDIDEALDAMNAERALNQSKCKR